MKNSRKKFRDVKILLIIGSKVIGQIEFQEK
jgi:hypothetical protein